MFQTKRSGVVLVDSSKSELCRRDEEQGRHAVEKDSMVLCALGGQTLAYSGHPLAPPLNEISITFFGNSKSLCQFWSCHIGIGFGIITTTDVVCVWLCGISELPYFC